MNDQSLTKTGSELESESEPKQKPDLFNVIQSIGQIDSIKDWEIKDFSPLIDAALDTIYLINMSPAEINNLDPLEVAVIKTFRDGLSNTSLRIDESFRGSLVIIMEAAITRIESVQENFRIYTTQENPTNENMWRILGNSVVTSMNLAIRNLPTFMRALSISSWRMSDEEREQMNNKLIAIANDPHLQTVANHFAKLYGKEVFEAYKDVPLLTTRGFTFQDMVAAVSTLSIGHPAYGKCARNPEEMLGLIKAQLVVSKLTSPGSNDKHMHLFNQLFEKLTESW